MKHQRILYILLTVLGVLAVDQITKIAAHSYLADQSIAVLPFFNLVLVWNKGVSFGFLGGASPASPYILAGMSLLVVTLLAVWLWRGTTAPLAVALSAVIGGALGNVIDRIWHGAVIDFLDFHAFGWHYPAFNIADSAIVLGIAFVVFDGLFLEPKRKELHENET